MARPATRGNCESQANALERITLAQRHPTLQARNPTIEAQSSTINTVLYQNNAVFSVNFSLYRDRPAPNKTRPKPTTGFFRRFFQKTSVFRRTFSAACIWTHAIPQSFPST